jgi:hypothetical protein
MDGVLVKINYKPSTIKLIDSKGSGSEMTDIIVVAVGEDVKRVKVGDSVVIDMIILNTGVDMTKYLGLPEDKTSSHIQIKEYQVWGYFVKEDKE